MIVSAIMRGRKQNINFFFNKNTLLCVVTRSIDKAEFISHKNFFFMLILTE